MVSIGDMNQVGLMQTNDPETTETGGKIDSFADTLTTRGRFRRLKGGTGSNRRKSDGRIEHQTEWEFITWYQSGMDNFRTRWIIDNKTYTVVDFEVIEYKPQQIKIILAHG